MPEKAAQILGLGLRTQRGNFQRPPWRVIPEGGCSSGWMLREGWVTGEGLWGKAPPDSEEGRKRPGLSASRLRLGVLLVQPA